MRIPGMDEPFIARNLFSQHFLTERLPSEDSRWKESEDQVKECYRQVSELFYAVKPDVNEIYSRNEANLEKDFIRPVLDMLGHSYDVNETIHVRYRGAGRPDYTLFPSEEVRNAVQEDSRKYLSAICGLCEAKAWDLDLDRTVRMANDRKANPSIQICNYLRDANVTWGILTNGRKWRIYNKDTGLQLDSYYEVDLVDLIEHKNHEMFRYFYLFMRSEAFALGEAGCSFLDNVLGASTRYARELEEDVKKNIYEALQLIIKGFLDHPDNRLAKADLSKIHENSLILLYRLLFVLYAEGKGLLPVDNTLYQSLGLQKLREDVRSELDKSCSTLTSSGDSLWSRLLALFKLVNGGSEARKIARDRLYIPPYNGGLFDPGRYPFLERNRVGDASLAVAIHLLSWSEGRDGRSGGYVDYTSLSIRHLGSIYEGLLEFTPAIAEEDLIVVRDKGRNVYKKWSEVDGMSPKSPSAIRVAKGELYLMTDKGERKTTGSYYTPDAVVRHIVESTLGPIVDGLITSRSVGDDILEEVLKVKILDPAMGSGHFLVEATTYLATRIVDALQDAEVSSFENTDVLWARREVASHCIYGVDLNPLAVELAKVSLWLHTITKDKPLSFLDHHLKCGNSLIGSRIEDTSWLPGERPEGRIGDVDKPFGLMETIISSLSELEQISDETVGDVKRKEALFRRLKTSDEYLRVKTVGDVHAAINFMQLDLPSVKKAYMDLVHEAYYGVPAKWRERMAPSWVRNSLIVAENMRPFHWELEFPEIFFEDGRRKKQAGFDAVIGNPPYVRIYRGQIPAIEVEYYSKFYKSAHMKFDLYVLFMELGLNLLRENGRFSMIVPDKWMTSPYGEPLRKMVLSYRFESLADMRGKRLFDDVSVDNVIPVVVRSEPMENSETLILTVEDSDNGSISLREGIRIAQSHFSKFPSSQIRTELTQRMLKLTERIRRESIVLGRICYVNWGLRTGTAEKTRDMISREKLTANHKPLIRGDDVVDRYCLRTPNQFIDYDTQKLYNPMFPELFERPKVVFRKISGRKGLMAALDADGNYGFATVIVAVNHALLEGVERQGVKRPTQESRQYENTWYILSLVNSRLVRWYYDLMLSDRLSVVPNHVKELPIRKIRFGMPSGVLREYRESIQSLVTSYLDCGVLADWHAFLKSRMKASSEETEVIYDLLGSLAEKATSLQFDRDRAASSFLSWIESPAGLGVSYSQFRNKTKLLEFHRHPQLGSSEARSELESVLSENSIHLDGDQVRRLRSEYETTSDTVRSLLNHFKAFDLLIDLVIYYLYGLDIHDIAVVENEDPKIIAAKYQFSSAGS